MHIAYLVVVKNDVHYAHSISCGCKKTMCTMHIAYLVVVKNDVHYKGYKGYKGYKFRCLYYNSNVRLKVNNLMKNKPMRKSKLRQS